MSPQPLTRADCDTIGMAWNENANVCGKAAQAAKAMAEPQFAQPMAESEVAGTVGQPLTRDNCARAGMTWNDSANVCLADSLSQPLTRLDCDGASMTWNDAGNVCVADSLNQPLTRLDCDRAGMTWNDAANVCGAASQAAEAMPEPQVAQPMPESEMAESLSQPLTRDDCDRAGMTWNDAANVCVAESLSQPLTRLDCDGASMTWNDAANVCVADSLSQPLTRLDCDRAGMTWNDAANVCGAASQAAEAMPEPQVAQPMPESEVAESLSQPLMRNHCDRAGITWNDAANVCGAAAQAAEAMAEPQVAQPTLERPDCEGAGMSWNDRTNVCGEQSQRSATQPKGANPVASTILINIDKTKQQMTVFLDGVESYNWPVSTGKAGYSTPSGTFTATSMNEIWYSKQWDNAPMPHAIFFMKDGHAIHGSYEVKNLGKPASHGCVRISPENAATLYALVEKTGLKNTQVVLAGDTGGGEGKVATKTRGKSAHRQASRSSRQYRNYYADTFPQRPRGGGFFRRLFGGQ
jgi:lipoprotein-anchoring transpeptidase ErfK/SrfK